MAESKWETAAFGVFDFFSFIIPGLLLLLPALVLPNVRDALIPGAFTSALMAWSTSMSASAAGTAGWLLLLLMAGLLVGLLVYRASRQLERRVLERHGPPSAWVLVRPGTPALKPPVRDQLRALARHHFGLDEAASDSQIWSLAYRYLIEEGEMGRVNRFLHLHNLTRSVMLASGVWVILSLGVLPWARDSAIVLTLGTIAAMSTVASNFLRGSYNRSMAEEVFVAYYVLRCEKLQSLPQKRIIPDASHDAPTAESRSAG